MDSDKDFFLTELFPSVATQLRNELGNIHFAAAALAPPEIRELDSDLDARAALLDRSYYQLLRLVNNLTAAAYFSEMPSFPLQDQDLTELVHGICRRADSLADLLGLKLEFICAQGQLLCAVSRDVVEQLLFQLLSNAFKFTPAGGTVSVELKKKDGYILLSVNDTGCGIEESMLPSLFNLYLHKELKNPPPHGLGLGLTICRHVAESLGGNIMAESKVGVGSKFTVFFPDRRVGSSGVSDVPFDYAGGFNHTLLELSDALPYQAFLLKNQD